MMEDVTAVVPIRGGRGPRAHAYTKQRAAEIARLFAEGKNPEQVAAALGVARSGLANFIYRHQIPVPHWAEKQKVGRISSKDSIHIVTGAVDALAGVAQGLQLLNGSSVAIEPELARQLLNDVRGALRPINALVAKLKEAAK